jgi:hypothetical protein
MGNRLQPFFSFLTTFNQILERSFHFAPHLEIWVGLTCGSVRCIYLYIVISPYVRGFPAYLHLCTIYCGLWPPGNISCIFLTWYQSIGFFFSLPHAQLVLNFRSSFCPDRRRPSPIRRRSAPISRPCLGRHRYCPTKSILISDQIAAVPCEIGLQSGRAHPVSDCSPQFPTMAVFDPAASYQFPAACVRSRLPARPLASRPPRRSA